MDTAEFLKTVVTADEGHFLLAIGPPTGQGWHEEWFKWPDDIDKIINSADKQARENNVYFSSYLFAKRDSHKEYVLPTRTIQADLDEADILTLPLPPTILVQTSPDRHQGYWVLREGFDLTTHEEISKRLTYSIPRCDHSGWGLGKRVRLPGTYNHKYRDGLKDVRVIVGEAAARFYNPADLESLPYITAPTPNGHGTPTDLAWATPLQMGPQELMAQFRTKLPARIISQYNVEAPDRSEALWALMLSCFRAGMSKQQVYHLAFHSANNKFKNLRYHGEEELARDVLRAEAATQSKLPDARERISKARRLPGLLSEKRQYLASIVRETLMELGEFIHTEDEATWFIRHDTGRPVYLAHRSEHLQTLLDSLFGLNSTEAETQYVVSNLTAYCSELPTMGSTAALAYFDRNTHTLLLHTGRREVLKISAESIDKVNNGDYGIVFPWGIATEPFYPSFMAPANNETWHDVLFGNCLDNLVGLEKEQALAILRTWLLFLLFRNAAVSRPILALFGQPGAGKSTLFRRVYALLYGRQRSLGAVTTPDDFDHAVAHDPLLVLDNVDTWERWLPDRLALSAASSELTKRKLYTDTDTVRLQRQALLGITAHNPKFGREDVTDRLLMLTFERLHHFLPEGDIIAAITKSRNQLWGQLVLDAQKVLQTPMPTHAEAPQFRVEDFARVGYWIAKALGIDEAFVGAIKVNLQEQKTFILDEESILIDAIQAYLTRGRDLDAWRTHGALWSLFENMTTDPLSFGRQYKNAVNLGKKLWSMQDALKSTFDIEWKHDPIRNARVWRIRNAAEKRVVDGND